MAASFKLHIATSRYVSNGVDAIRVRVECVEACGAPTKIFAYLMSTINPLTMERAGSFSHICSPTDLEEYPEDEPIPRTSPQFFRLNYVDVLVRSYSEADNDIEIIRQHVERLRKTLDTVACLEELTEVFVGELTCGDESDSASDTPSESAGSEGAESQFLLTVSGGSYEDSYGPGVRWTDTGIGAGSPLMESESLYGGMGAAYSRVVLGCSQHSSLLAVQCYDFSSIPADAKILGFGCRMIFRYSPDGAAPALSQLAFMHWASGLSDNLAAAANTSITVVDAENRVVQVEIDPAAESLHGMTITTTHLKTGDFGVVLAFAAVPGRPAVTIDVDGVELFVRYSHAD